MAMRQLITKQSRLVLIVLTAIGLLLAAPQSASAHAALESSSPTSGELLATAPAEVTATFTEPLEQTYSQMELYDGLGNLVQGTSLTFGDDGYTMVLALPASLPEGTYSVLWRTFSTADGHPAQNYFTFTVGTNADIAAVTTPGTASDAGEVPQWAKTTSRWAALLGAFALIACWPVWITVIRPALGPAWREAPPIVRRMRRFATAAAIAAALGSIYALIVQAWTLSEGTLLDKVVTTLGQTRYGHLWLARFGLIAGLGLVLAACGWWFTKRRQAEGYLAWGLSIALALPFSLIAHASAQTSGRSFAIAVDAAHLLAAATWGGGLAILAIVVTPGLRRMDPATRGGVLARLVPRFSTLALIAIAIVSLTGFYAGGLEVGNLEALRSTAYGRSLIVKLALFALILVLAAINLFVIERRLRNRHQVPVWTLRLRWTVSGELVLVVLLLLAVGRMTSLQPARDVMVERARQAEIAFETTPSSTLLLAPGIAGVNHFRLEVDGPPLPTDTDALLRLTIPGRDDLGTKEIQLSRVAGNAFEHHGNEIGIAADWEITVILREPGTAPVTASTVVTVGTTAPNVDVPGPPWRFEAIGGITGLALVLAGIAGLLVATRTGNGATRKESAGLGAAALILGVILLIQARIDPILANAPGKAAIDPTDVAMVERGEAIYAAQCLSCHGANLRGDGPASAGMDPPPADFTAPHTMAHGAEDLVYWVRNGKQGTAMPAFDDTLSDQEIRDVLSYIAAEQAAMSGSAESAADPATCTVAPLAMANLEALAGQGGPAATVDPVSTGATASDEILGGIERTMGQMLACTNATDTMRRLALFTDDSLASAFAAGIPEGFAAAAAGESLPQEHWLTLVAIRDVTMLEDGRVMAKVEIVDPASHFHDLGIAGEDGAAGTITAQVVFAEVDGEWLIDGIVTP